MIDSTKVTVASSAWVDVNGRAQQNLVFFQFCLTHGQYLSYPSGKMAFWIVGLSRRSLADTLRKFHDPTVPPVS
jgi:hypothetical protein